MNTAILGDIEEPKENPLLGMSIMYIVVAGITGILTMYMTAPKESLALLSELMGLPRVIGPKLKLTETLILSFSLIVYGLLLTNSSSTLRVRAGGVILTAGWSSVVTPVMVNYLVAVDSFISIHEEFTSAAIMTLSVIVTGVIYLSRRYIKSSRATRLQVFTWITHALIATSMLAVFIPELSTLLFCSVSGLVTALWLVGRITALPHQGDLGVAARNISLNCLLISLLFIASTMIVVGLTK